MTQTRASRVVLFLILCASVIAFAGVWRAPFLAWDDDANITNNPFYAAGAWAVFWKTAYYGMYVPLVSTAWEILYRLGGGSPIPFRVFNAGLHFTNVCLAYRVLRLLGRVWRIDSEWVVLAGLGLFAFHPMQVEAVAWISGGRDLLAATFSLSLVLVYFGSASRRNAALSTLLFVAAMLSKPNSVVLPVIIYGLDYWARPAHRRRALALSATWLALAAYPVLVIYRAQLEHLTDVEWWLRPWIMADTYAFYLRKLLWPWPLTANYARTPDYVLANERTLWVALLAVLGLLCAFTWAWFRDKRFLFGAAWLAALLPVSGLVPFGYQKISTPADHYHYLPMLVIAGVVMLLLEHLSEAWRRPVMVSTGGLWAVLLFATCVRVPAWASNRAFFEDMVDYNPSTFSAAIGMSLVDCAEREDFDAGVHWTDVALAQRPNDITAIANQAYCFLHARNHIRVTEMEYILNHLKLNDLEAKQPSPYSSFLASIGTAEMELQNFEVGYQYTCEAYRILPSQPIYRQNLEIATQILKDHHLEARCDPNFQVAPGYENLRDDDGGGGEGPDVD